MLPVLLLDGGVDEGVIVAELEEALDPGRRVLGALPVVPVRERHDESGALEPLLLAGRDKLGRHGSAFAKVVASGGRTWSIMIWQPFAKSPTAIAKGQLSAPYADIKKADTGPPT